MRVLRALALAWLCWLTPLTLAAQTAAPPLLPRPSELRERPDLGAFTLRSPVQIVVDADGDGWREVGELLAAGIRAQTGFTVTLSQNRARSVPRLRAASVIRIGDGLRAANAESYTLSVSAQGASITAVTPQGAVWGTQTLRQLLPPAFDAVQGDRRESWMISAVEITDTPRFAWRGTMLDVVRHFLPLDAVKRHIDLMSRYKLNVLHWHLTDDQGWRIAIEKYPALTTVGAWRTELDGTRTGGFYTKAEVRDVVEYARRRGIMVVPEIEMPGHAVAALAAYPELGCTGERLPVPTTWGVFSDILCVGNPVTFTFVQDVLDEVIALFPAPFVHIGGDEVPKERWKACASCQEVIRREGLANEEELQRWFTDSIGRFLASRGKRLIGWNEIMHGGKLLPTTVVQSWEDTSWTRRGIEAGHDVIASPNPWLYLDASPRDRPLSRVYEFEPVPPGATAEQARRVLGGEVPYWSERITSPANLELMAWPRTLAFAEIMWSSAPRDLPALHARLNDDHLGRLRGMGVAVGPADRSLVSMRVVHDTASGRAQLRVVAGVPEIRVHMTQDGTAPTSASPVVTDGEPLTGTGVRRILAFYGSQTIGEERRVELTNHQGVGARVATSPAADARYPGTGSASMADGLVGSIEHGDGLWQGWWGPDVRFDLELASPTPAREVRVAFMQKIGSWIVLPKAVEFSWSSDGITWSAATIVSHEIPVLQPGGLVHPFVAMLPADARVRFLRIHARSAGVLPTGHPGAGQPSWIFADEIVIR
jgi:hexosaminidase